MGNERPFNFAQLLLDRLDLLFQKANEGRVDGEPFLWYRVLTAITTTIIFKLNDKEEEAIETELTKVRAQIRNKRTQNEEVFFFEVEKSLNEIEKTIVKLMFKYDLYYPKYDKRSWQEKAKDEDI